jgi:hypothetical protein
MMDKFNPQKWSAKQFNATSEDKRNRIPIKDKDSNVEERIKNYFRSLYEELSKSHPQLFESIRKYKSDAYFNVINNIKRMGEQGYREQLKAGGKLSEVAEDRIQDVLPAILDIEIFLDKSRLPEEISVYRMISTSTLDIIRSKEGSFVDSGFVSTSFTINDAKKYHKLKCIKIIIPEGTRVIDMTSALSHTKWQSTSGWENELVIGDNYEYEVKNSDSDAYDLILKIKGKDKTK